MANGTKSTKGTAAKSAPAVVTQPESAVSKAMANYSAWDENTDYRNGIPYALKKQLEADGYEMDAKAVAASAKSGDTIEFFDVQTGEKFTYKKTIETEVNDFNGNEYTVSHFVMTSGSSSVVTKQQKPYGEDGLINMPNGIVAKMKQSPAAPAKAAKPKSTKKSKSQSKPITQAQLVSWSTATLKSKLKTASPADKKKIKAELAVRGVTSNIG